MTAKLGKMGRNEYYTGLSVGDDENVLILIVVTQLYEYPKNHCTIYFKRVNCMVM